jgi:tyrosine-specific transport protein
MYSKLIGGILLIVGTSIGAGMLALPIATAQLGFIGSLLLLLGGWLTMTMGAFYLLEANLWQPQNSNIITMAKATIGRSGQVIAWVTYLLLLYSILCAYIAGGSELLHNLLQQHGMSINSKIAAIIFTLVFGGIVCSGIRVVDYANRGLMFLKLSALFLLVIVLMPFVEPAKLLTAVNAHIYSGTALIVTITSFGFACIVPSLRIYFASDVKKLKIAILVGSLIPLVCYIFWDAVIMGVIPIDGANGLLAISQSKTAVAELVNNMSAISSGGTADFCIKLFTSVCVVTSFLGVGLCLTDFLADGLKLEKEGSGNVVIQALTFLPPMILVLFYPNAFITALKYAGIYCVILLMLLPAWMVWCGRYRQHITSGYRVAGGKAMVGSIIVIALALIIKGLFGS